MSDSMMSRLAREAELVVDAVQAALPPEVREVVAAVPVHFDSRPDSGCLHSGIEPDTLGLFDGASIRHPDDFMPPQVVLWIENIWEASDFDARAFREEVRVTYLHEIGHFLGWSEQDLRDRGLD